MLALSIRQPYAELILRGIKTIEYRSRPTRIIGERFWIYAAGKWPRKTDEAVWSTDLSTTGAAPPPWMMELAQALIFNDKGGLPTGVIVGSAVIEQVTPRDDGMFQWHLGDVERTKSFRKPKAHPQPVLVHAVLIGYGGRIVQRL